MRVTTPCIVAAEPNWNAAVPTDFKIERSANSADVMLANEVE